MDDHRCGTSLDGAYIRFIFIHGLGENYMSLPLGRLMEGISLSGWRKDRYHLYDQWKVEESLYCASHSSQWSSHTVQCVSKAIRSDLIAKYSGQLQNKFSLAFHGDRFFHTRGEKLRLASKQGQVYNAHFSPVNHAKLISRAGLFPFRSW